MDWKKPEEQNNLLKDNFSLKKYFGTDGIRGIPQKTLEEVDIIAAEDTRRTKKLLSHFQIKGKKIFSYYSSNYNNLFSQIIWIECDILDVVKLENTIKNIPM